MRDRWPAWLPYMGWTDVAPQDAWVFGLDARHRWQVLVVEWFGHGFSLRCRRVADA